MKAQYPDAPLLIGRNEAHLLGDPTANLSAPFGLPLTSPPADRLLDDGERLDLAGLAIEVRPRDPRLQPRLGRVRPRRWPTPGRPRRRRPVQAGSIGRTCGPGERGDFPQLASGIRSRLYSLPDATVIWPGHGPSTTVGTERRNNPFVRDQP